jgi:ribosomal protein S18 acetylase RimI-like enzyme
VASDPSNLSLAQAGEEDRDFVRQLSGRVFARFGDYDRTLPVWMGLPEIETILARVDEERVGFAMYGTKTLSPGTLDLLAIAVAPEKQSQGIGRRLLRHCEEVARRRGTAEGRCEIEVTVADDNERARRLFEGSGYLIVPGEHGSYPQGQLALTLRKSLT